MRSDLLVYIAQEMTNKMETFLEIAFVMPRAEFSWTQSSLWRAKDITMSVRDEVSKMTFRVGFADAYDKQRWIGADGRQSKSLTMRVSKCGSSGLPPGKKEGIEGQFKLKKLLGTDYFWILQPYRHVSYFETFHRQMQSWSLFKQHNKFLSGFIFITQGRFASLCCSNNSN